MQTAANYNLSLLTQESWQIIAPFWPLKNLIAVNPLQGFENMPVEEAFTQGAAYFQPTSIPKAIEEINRETIKWLQVYCDEGQATIAMPFRNKGLYAAWRQITSSSLPESAEEAIEESLKTLGIPKELYVQFMQLLLTTLPGWSSYIKYLTEWSEKKDHTLTSLQTDYLAVRLALACCYIKDGKTVLDWHTLNLQSAKNRHHPLLGIAENEHRYRVGLLKKLAASNLDSISSPKAQLVFCIDVRSEPFRRALEATGNYETFGFAGFFGIPVRIKNAVTEESYASCPVLLAAKHEVVESPSCSLHKCEKGHRQITKIKMMYQAVKYSFTTPFALVEALGPACGAWMMLRTFMPRIASHVKCALKRLLAKPWHSTPSLDNISIEEQANYANSALRMIGLTQNFAPVVVFCGHGSTTENNAFATMLDCGACGGQHGASNARILVKMLNDAKVRQALAHAGIQIPQETVFIAAKHNTTTDEVTLFDATPSEHVSQLIKDLEKAKKANSATRLKQLPKGSCIHKADKKACKRSQDWAEVRPEWGLAKNAAFIVAPRAVTKGHDLEGRCFLHSYDYSQDENLSTLTTILCAPMVVAQWINSQYLFSTVDNRAFGAGSKTTQNITGKIGIMQGNASDLMTGLPLQSVYTCDKTRYHDPQRLMTVVYAPRKMLDAVVAKEPVLQKLFGNGWVQLACIDPLEHKSYFLERDFTWKTLS